MAIKRTAAVVVVVVVSDSEREKRNRQDNYWTPLRRHFGTATSAPLFTTSIKTPTARVFS